MTRIRVARKKRGANLAFLSFACVADRVAAGAAVAAAPPPPGMKRGSRPAVKDDNRRTILPASVLDVRDVVAPLWRLPYASQLALKWGKVAAALGRLGGDGGGPGAWAAALTPIGILRSPATRGYRNKCEFSVGPGVGGEEAGAASPAPPKPCVGFCLGAFKDGVVEVGAPGPAPHVSTTAAAVADAMTAFLGAGGGGAALAAWDKGANAGFWRLLTVREARAVTPMPAPRAGAAPAALLEEALAEAAAPCPPFADLEWGRWLVPAGVLPPAPVLPGKDERGEGAAVVAPPPPAAAGGSPPPPPPPLPPPEEVMLVIQVDPTAAPPATAAAELAALGEVLVAAVAAVAATAGTPPPATSVWVQHHSGPSNAADEGAPLMCLRGGGGEKSAGAAGDGCLTDSLAGLRFRVSPSSFFQVNTPAAALLYRAAVAWAAPAPGDVVLDVCCGTGTLGVCAATVAAACGAQEVEKGTTRVLGVDIVPAAIADAVANAATNGLGTEACTFVAGRAEDVMAGLLATAAGAGGGGGGGGGGGEEGGGPAPPPPHPQCDRRPAPGGAAPESVRRPARVCLHPAHRLRLLQRGKPGRGRAAAVRGWGWRWRRWRRWGRLQQ